jgi:acylphosphatase
MDDDEEDGMLGTRVVRVRGIVQGIRYREACVRRAHALALRAGSATVWTAP